MSVFSPSEAQSDEEERKAVVISTQDVNSEKQESLRRTRVTRCTIQEAYSQIKQIVDLDLIYQVDRESFLQS